MAVDVIPLDWFVPWGLGGQLRFSVHLGPVPLPQPACADDRLSLEGEGITHNQSWCWDTSQLLRCLLYKQEGLSVVSSTQVKGWVQQCFNWPGLGFG